MGKYVAESLVKTLIKADKPVKNAKVGILGFTFKENCPDTRNTKVIDIYNELMEYGITPVVVDPAADADEAKRLYGITFQSMDDMKDMDAVIIAVCHDQFSKLTESDIDGFFKAGADKKVLLYLKGILDRKAYDAKKDYLYWRL
jgi:UDP-N-acetyl-D-galactosamine dehydrogenase